MVLIFLTLLFILVLAVFFVQIVDRKRRSGKKPWSKCIVDVVCSYVMIFHTGPWAKDSYPGVLLSGTEANVWGTTEKFIKRIMIESKKTDLGGSLHSLSHNYDLILQGIIKSGVALSPFGYFFINESLKQKMQQRLGLVNFIANHPHIESISVRKPVIITGLTRTGTTFLHELLHLHPDGRSHVLWEQLSGIPEMSAWADDESLVTRKEERVKRRRQQKGDFDFGMSLIGTEALQIIHRVGYDLPEECTNIIAFEAPLMFQTIGFMVFVAKECNQIGAGNAFIIYKKWLQLMTWQDEERHGDFRWVLKCPFYLPYLAELNETFPDANIVWMHRDPVECIASACSLYESMMDMTCNTWTIDRIALGRAVLNYSELQLQKAEEAIKKNSNRLQITHVRYEALVEDPKRVVRRLSRKVGLIFTKEFEDSIDCFLRRNAADRAKLKKDAGNTGHQIHPYSLGVYGLDEATVLKRLEKYILKYNLRPCTPSN